MKILKNLKKFKKLNFISALCLSTFVGLSGINTAHASIKTDLQQEATRLSTFAASSDIQNAVKKGNQDSNQNSNQKINKADLTDLTSNDLSKKLSDNQQSSSMKIVGSMVTDAKGNSLGQTVPAKSINYRFAENFIKAQSSNPKITSRIKTSFNPTPVARIVVPVLDSSQSNSIIGTVTEWVDTGDQDKNKK